MDCIFCKIADKRIQSDLILNEPDIVAFKDISPQAPVHLLIIPKKHLANLNDAAADPQLLGKMLNAASRLAAQFNIAETGYRTVINCNSQGGQTVYHLHLHVLGGRQLGGSMVG